MARAASQSTVLTGHRALVVGGTAGIGHGIALRLAQAGVSVTIAGRSESRGQAVVAQMTAAAAGIDPPPTFEFIQLNAFSLPACATFTTSFAAKGTLDLLVLTQGMATIQGYTPTPLEDGGLDQKMTLAYWSRALLASALAPAMKASPDPRVLTVLSAGVHGPYKHYANDPELSRGHYSIKNAADSTGCYNDVLVDQLSAENPTISYLHAAPGFVATSWGTVGYQESIHGTSG